MDSQMGQWCYGVRSQIQSSKNLYDCEECGQRGTMVYPSQTAELTCSCCGIVSEGNFVTDNTVADMERVIKRQYSVDEIVDFIEKQRAWKEFEEIHVSDTDYDTDILPFELKVNVSDLASEKIVSRAYEILDGSSEPYKAKRRELNRKKRRYQQRIAPVQCNSGYKPDINFGVLLDQIRARQTRAVGISKVLLWIILYWNNIYYEEDESSRQVQCGEGMTLKLNRSNNISLDVICFLLKAKHVPEVNTYAWPHIFLIHFKLTGVRLIDFDDNERNALLRDFEEYHTYCQVLKKCKIDSKESLQNDEFVWPTKRLKNLCQRFVLSQLLFNHKIDGHQHIRSSGDEIVRERNMRIWKQICRHTQWKIKQ